MKKIILPKKILDIRKLPYWGTNLHMRFELPMGHEAHGFQPDVQCMPIYCQNCRRALSDLYCHCGSRYGIVGEVKCDHCGHVILVTDGDNIVNAIEFDGMEIEFNELYKFHWKYTSQIERERNVDLKALFADTKGCVPIDNVINRLQGATGKLPTGRWQYITDRRFPRLPGEINLWLEFLELCGVSGLFLDKTEKEPFLR